MRFICSLVNATKQVLDNLEVENPVFAKITPHVTPQVTPHVIWAYFKLNGLKETIELEQLDIQFPSTMREEESAYA